MEIQYHTVPALIAGHDPSGLKVRKIMPLYLGPGVVGCPHHFSQSVLSFPGRFQRAVFQSRLHVRQPFMNHFRG